MYASFQHGIGDLIHVIHCGSFLFDFSSSHFVFRIHLDIVQPSDSFNRFRPFSFGVLLLSQSLLVINVGLWMESESLPDNLDFFHRSSHPFNWTSQVVDNMISILVFSPHFQFQHPQCIASSLRFSASRNNSTKPPQWPFSACKRQFKRDAITTITKTIF